MADQLKEIATATITPEDLTGNQFSGTLFTTDANTQYHATEITLGGTLPIAADIEVNNFKATQITQEQKGSAIIDVSSSVRLAFQSPVEFTQEHINIAVSTGTGDITNTFAVNGVEVKQQSSIVGNDLVINVSQGGLFSQSSSGDIFYHQTDLSTTTRLSRLSGGSVTTIDQASSRPKAFDGARYYYWLNAGSNGVERYDIETGLTTTINLAASVSAPSTHPRLVYSGGLLLYITTTSGQFALIDISTGRVAYINGISYIFTNGSSNVGFYFDPDTRACSIFAWSTTINKATVFAPNFTASSVTVSGLVSGSKSTSFFIPSLTTNRSASTCATGRNTFISAVGNNLVYEYDFDTPAPLRLIGPLSSNRTVFYAKNSVASPTSADFPVTAKVRFAGVETTI